MACVTSPTSPPGDEDPASSRVQPMRFLVVGCGSIGERHIRNLCLLGYEVRACDPRADRRQRIVQAYGLTGCEQIEEAFDPHPDGVLICTPPSIHISQATLAIGQGIPVFVEKPLAHDLNGLDRFLDDVAASRVPVLVGCNLRFLESLRMVKRLAESGEVGRLLSVRAEFGFYLPFWHLREDYRTGYSARADLGGGIILDAIHEIDLACWFLGEVESVFAMAAHLSGLEIDTEDTAKILLRFTDGTLADLHLDYLRRTFRRSLTLLGEDGVLEWDYARQTVQLYGKDAYRSTLYEETVNYDPNVMYLRELEHFVACIRGESAPLVDAAEARRILEVVMAAKDSARKGLPVALRPHLGSAGRPGVGAEH